MKTDKEIRALREDKVQEIEKIPVAEPRYCYADGFLEALEWVLEVGRWKKK